VDGRGDPDCEIQVVEPPPEGVRDAFAVVVRDHEREPTAQRSRIAAGKERAEKAKTALLAAAVIAFFRIRPCPHGTEPV
jgi:hypothetical protein